MIKVVIIVRILLIIILIISTPTVLFAEEFYDKLGRGFGNLLFGWADIFITMEKRCEVRGYVSGPFTALPEGIYRGLCRTFVGLQEIVTCADTEDSGSVIIPEYVFQYELSESNIDIEALTPEERAQKKRSESIDEKIKLSEKKVNSQEQGVIPEFNMPEIENEIALDYYKTKKAYENIKHVRAQEERRALISKSEKNIDRLYALAKEEEHKGNFETAVELYKKILKIASNPELRSVIDGRKNAWVRQSQTRGREGLPGSPDLQKVEGGPEKIHPLRRYRKISDTDTIIAAKVEESIKRDEESEGEVVDVIVVSEEPLPEFLDSRDEYPEDVFANDVSKKISDGEQLMECGEGMLKQKRFREAYDVFEKAFILETE